MVNQRGCPEWVETARWVKFEEDVEVCGKRWSKPHVGLINFRVLRELQQELSHCVFMLDLEVDSMEDVMEKVLDEVSSFFTGCSCS